MICCVILIEKSVPLYLKNDACIKMCFFLDVKRIIELV